MGGVGEGNHSLGITTPFSKRSAESAQSDAEEADQREHGCEASQMAILIGDGKVEGFWGEFREEEGSAVLIREALLCRAIFEGL